jgi:hypothetical protein
VFWSNIGAAQGWPAIHKRNRSNDLDRVCGCFEGRCSIQLSYGRVACIDSKSFIASWSSILKALTLYRIGRRSIQTELQANSPTIVSSSSYSDLFNGSDADSRSIQSNWCFFGRTFKAQTLLTQQWVHFVASVRNQIVGKYVLTEIACLVSRSFAASFAHFKDVPGHFNLHGSQFRKH